MPALTSGQLTTLRANGHKAKFYLSISQPATLLTALINGSPARGATSISYDTGGGTGFSRIKAGQTLLVVTSTGTKNARIRGISGDQTSGTITVAANEIVWADNQALTVLEDYEPHSWIPYFNEAGQFYKDWDIAYPGLYPSIPPVCIAGPHRAKFIESESINTRVAAGADDGYLRSGGGPSSFNSTSTSVNLGSNGTVNYSSWFRVILPAAIPASATITSAKLTLYPASSIANPVQLKISAEDAADPDAPTSEADYNSRVLTTAQLDWDFSTAWTQDVAIQTPDLSAIVQELVTDNGGLAAGNAIQLFIRNDGGSNIRAVRAIEHNPEQAALLEIEYIVSAAFPLDISSSYAVAHGTSIASYTASIVPATGVTIDFNTSTGIGTVTITQAGQYWLEAGCTDTNSQSQTTRRRLIAHSDDPDSDDYPYTDFTVTALSGDWERGGWVLNIEVNGTADTGEFPENALIMLWYETWYGNNKEYIGGISDAPQMLFVGYIRKGTVTANWDRGSVSFEAATIEAILREQYMRSVPLQATASPDAWYEYANWLTPGRAVHHLWRWHSNLLEIADVFGLTASTLRRKYCDFSKGNLYGQADTLLRQQSIAAHVVSNKAGQIYVVQDIQLLDDTSRAARTTVASILLGDRQGDITITEQDQTVALVQVEGFYFDGSDVTPYCAYAPGDVPEERGPSELSVTEQVLASQDHANNLAGRHLAVANNKNPEARIKFSGIYVGVLDIAGPFDGTPGSQEWWQIDLAAGDTTRGIVWTNKKMVCRMINNQIDPANGMILSETVFEPEAEGPPGVADMSCQEEATATSAIAPDWDSGIGALATFSSLYYRDDNDSDWSEHNTEFSFNHGCVDLYWKNRQGTANPLAAILWGVGAGIIKRSVDAGRTWDDKTPVTDPPNTWSDSPAPAVANLSFIQIVPDPWTVGRFIALATWQNSSGLWRGWLLVTPDDGASWSWYAPYTGDLPAQIRPVWAAINGASLLTTTWEDRTTTTKLMLHRRGATSLSFVAEHDLGNTTLAELIARTYLAFPVCVQDDDTLWHVAGRMNAPVGLTGTQHVIITANAGSAWSSFESGWSTDYCSALQVGLLSDSNRDYKAVRQQP